jgi:uncharacterized protein (TIGR02271 family)
MTTATTAGAREGQDTLQLREEELRARKQTVETGEVTVGKEIVSEQRTLEVPTTREEVVVERHPVDRRPAERPISGTDEQTIEVPVREERVEVEKRPVVYEEVAVGKQQVVENRQVSETVRREEARIEREGNVDLRGADQSTGTSPSWDQAMPEYRSRWEQRAGASGGRWEEVEPGYRYGWELRNDSRYRGRSWDQVESDVQRDWSTRHRDTPWERVRDSIRDSWEASAS